MASVESLGDNKYKIYVDVDMPGKRKRRTRTITAKSDRAVKRAVEKFVIEVSEEDNLVSDLKFSQFLPKWWTMRVEELHMRTQESYRAVLDKKDIKKYFGDYRLADIRSFDIARYFDQQRKKNVGGLKAVYICLCSIFSAAEKWDLIPISPMRKIDAPEVKKIEREVKSYTAAQLKQLNFKIGHSSVSEKNRIAFKLGFLTDMRVSEIAGIRLSLIDFERRSIRLERQVQWDKKNKVFRYNPLKNGKKRIVYFPPKFKDELQAFAEQQKKEKEDCGNTWHKFIDKSYSKDPIDLLFTSNGGHPMHPDSISHAWIRFIRTVDILPNLNFHGLRHSGVSYMINSGVPVRYAQEQAGHSSSVITDAVYNHTEEEKRSAYMSVFDTIL
ncbi:MAG: tyrosine-type recombinase/integrase [Sporolactobacillus sp.]